MDSRKFKLFSKELYWMNEAKSIEIVADDCITITCGAETDWFFDPANDRRKNNAPVALFHPSDETFLLTAKVNPFFKSAFDAGVLMVYRDQNYWAKLCFEYSPANKPMIVSVVTRGKSDDCNSAIIGRDTVFLRVYRNVDVLAFHYSENGHYWHLVRYFSIGSLQNLQVGFSSQSPTGEGCQVQFLEIKYQVGELSDLRNGE